MTNAVSGAMPEVVLALAQERFKPLHLVIDASMNVVTFFGDAAYYGYPNWKPGDDLSDVLHILHGMEPVDCIEIPFVETPNQRSATIRIETKGDQWEIIFYDMSAERDQRQESQQSSNELAILSDKQKELMEKLKTVNGELEVKRREAEQASLMKSRFIANMSHEFRTPLSSIVGYSQFLSNAQAADAMSSGNAAIERAAKHLMGLVENLLEQAQLEIGETRLNLQATDMKNMAAEMESFFAPVISTKLFEFVVSTDSKVPPAVSVDPLRVRQILINILGNACKYTMQGRIFLEVAWVEGVLKVEVTDTGPGIRAETLANVYVPFHREAGATQSGAGLGLSITKQLLDIMGGTIEVDSKLEIGTTVRVSLPAPRVAAQQITPSRDATAVDRKLLIVEDDRDIFEIVSISLKNSGYNVAWAERPSLALELCRKLSPDVVLLDLNMQEMDGCALTEALRRDGYAKPIVMLTASNLHHDRQRALESGCSDFLVKPVSPSELVRVLNAHCDNISSTEIEVLRQRYRVALGKKADEFIKYRDYLHKPQMRNELIEMLHRIAGSAAVYNIMELSNAACSLESSVAQCTANEYSETHEQRAELDALLAVIRKAASV